jgi:hypothetical protein
VGKSGEFLSSYGEGEGEEKNQDAGEHPVHLSRGPPEELVIRE